MTVGESDAAREIFEGAAKIRSKRLRNVFLDNACAGDEALRAQVVAMLKKGGRLPGATHEVTVESEAPSAEDDAIAASEEVGDHIGPYKLLQQVGEGGFGVVYMAEQEEPVRRRVALKIIKLGMDTRQVIARFEAERQALALMDHPNIARVLDAGATDLGRPYFVMELVKGEPITKYCDKHNLSVPDRLKLFQHVCEAVQHAHQKGIIHRDIKPSNVMVTLHDGKPVPKVIDFGIAKATDQRLTEKTMFTAHQQMIGTPAYMSPEQAEMSGLDVDTRSDVYSLGVLLYELLTGTTPFDAASLRSAGYAEIQRMIREDMPHKPSTRINSLESLEAIASKRHTEPKKLGTLIRGDLDWIVMKAMEKDRTRRYESASGFADDVQRYLDNEPVVASPPSASYRLRKFVRRNRAGVAAAGLVVAALVLGAFGTTWGMMRALNEKDRADDAAESATIAAAAERKAKQEAEAAAIAARDAEVTARLRADELERVAAFQAEQLSGIDLLLMGLRLRDDLVEKVRASAANAQMEETEVDARVADLERIIAGADFTGMALETLEENVFDRALEAIEAQFADQPVVKARLLQTIADTLREVGLLEKAEAPQAEAVDIRETELGRAHPDTLESMRSQAILKEMMGRFDEAEETYNRVLNLRRRELGESHPQTFASMNDLGVLYRKTDRFDESERMYTQALEGRRRVLGDDHPSTLATMSNLAGVYRDQERFDEAEALGIEVMERAGEVLGEEDAITLAATINLAILYRRQRRYDDAEPLYERTLEIQQRVRGFEHPSTLSTMNNLANLYRDQGRYDEAESLGEQAVEIMERVLGPDHPTTLIASNSLAIVYQLHGKLKEARSLFESVVARRVQVHGPDNVYTVSSKTSLGLVYEDLDQWKKAEPLHRAALAGRRATIGDDHRDTIVSMARLGRVLIELDEFDEAETLLTECHDACGDAFGAEHWVTADALSLLAMSIAGQGRYDEAEPMLEEAHEMMSAADTTEARERAVVERLVSFYDAWHEAKPDAGHDAKAAEWRSALDELTVDADDDG